MLFYTIIGCLCVTQAGAMSRLTDAETQNVSLRNEATATKTEVFKLLLNQETLIRMSLVKDVNSIMEDMLEVKGSVSTNNIRLGDVEKEISSLKNELQLLKTENQKLKEQGWKFQDDFKTSSHKFNEIDRNLSHDPSKTSVGFTVGTTRESPYWATKILGFDHVITNNGNGYSPSTGKFTAPTDGTYVFFVTVNMYIKNYLYLDIVHNDRSKVRTMSHQSASFQTGTNMAVLQLIKGDSVWVSRYTGHGYYSESVPITTFSGFHLSNNLLLQT
uniref:Caprin-2 n=1 Tax=Magallana gigas TaxID=29159 RepID=K1PZ60_MAGGI